MRKYARFFLTAKGERAARRGHPWVFGAEVVKTEGSYAQGDIVDVLSPKGKYLGSGLVNDASKIRVRLLSANANDTFDEAFWRRRLAWALDYRQQVLPPEDLRCCRLLFGEADGFPGLTVDRFDDVLVAQVLSLGIERRKELIFELLIALLRERGQVIRGLYQRNDVKIRELEGLEQGTGWFASALTPQPGDAAAVIVENGLRYRVDVAKGQKTGFFLDQKYNRQAVARLARGRRVLDLFTHTGSFALNAARGGAAAVTAADISGEALKLAEQTAKENGYGSLIRFRQANVFDLLTELTEKHSKDYDFIILDPPAFTKSSSTLANALRGYKEINLKAMKLLPRGGYLATCSCSHFVKEEHFRNMLEEAAGEAAVSLRQIEARQQSPDHPILWRVPETAYLKFYIFQVI